MRQLGRDILHRWLIVPLLKPKDWNPLGSAQGIASRGCDLPAPDIWLPLPALISPQQGVHSDPFNRSSSIITCKIVILNQYTYDLFSRVLTFPPPVAKTLTSNSLLFLFMRRVWYLVLFKPDRPTIPSCFNAFIRRESPKQQ